MSPDEAIARACDGLPGLVQASLALLPEGLLIASVGAESAFDSEPIVRAAVRCLLARNMPIARGESASAFVEYVLLVDEQLVAIQAGRSQPRLALALLCERSQNIGLVVTASRRALREIEATIDVSAWEA